MDLLDNYKKAWDNQPEDTNKVSSLEIYKMAQSKSSSIVKWIFIIGILEFVVLNSLYFFVDMDEASAEYKKLGIENFVFYSQIAAYIILFYFLVRFYQNYQRISATESTKVLMKKILRTRKTVRNYVLFNLGNAFLVSMVYIISTIKMNLDVLNTKQLLLLTASTLIATLLIICVLYLFYQLLYGILLRKLNRNYKELASLNN